MWGAQAGSLARHIAGENPRERECAMRILRKPSVRFLVLASISVGLTVGSGALASGAGPFSKLATIRGGGGLCGTTKATGCTVNVQTFSAIETRAIISGVEVRLECQENGKGTGWNPGGSPPKQNASADSLAVTKCVLPKFASCNASVAVSGLPWEMMATTDGAGSFAMQTTIPSGGLALTLTGTCPMTGTFEISGTYNGALINAIATECEPLTYAHCTYDKREGESSGKLAVKKEGKSLGTATQNGESFFYCTGGGSCTAEKNQMTVE